jgi:hypothetical protein
MTTLWARSHDTLPRDVGVVDRTAMWNSGVVTLCICPLTGRYRKVDPVTVGFRAPRK